MPDLTPLLPDPEAENDLTQTQGKRAVHAPMRSAGAAGREEIHRLEEEIATKRRRVIASLGELRRRVKGATNWRHWVESHPALWMCAGVSLGILLGYRGHQNKRRR